MAITETRPATQSASGAPEIEHFVGLADHDPGGLAGFIGTGDHKALGRAYIFVSLLFGVGAFVLEALFHAHLAKSFLPDDSVGQVATLGQIGLVLLFAIPFFVGLGTYLAPLQVGARTLAFPRAAAMAFWGWVVGSGLLIGAYAINGGPDGGRPKAVDLSYAALAIVIVSIVLATICILTTIIALRVPDLRLTRVPLFAWSMLVAGSMWLFTLPVLLGSIALIYVDHHYGESAEFGTAQWGQLWWAFSVPTIYMVAIPALGAISDVISTLSGVRQVRRGIMMTAIGAFGVLSFGAFVQPFRSPDILDEGLTVAMGVLIVLPVLGLLAGWATSLRSGKPLFKSSLIFAVGSGLLVLVATIGGALYFIKPLKLHDAGWILEQGAPPYADGQMLVVVAAATLAGLGAVVHWAPKLFGRFVADGPAKLAALVALLGGLVAGLPLMVYGFSLKFTGLADASEALNGISAAGSALLVVAVLIVVASLITGGGGERPADDAWGRGQSLEWATTCPPPAANFGELALVESAEPVLDAAESQEAS